MDLLTTEEIAAELRLHEATIRRWCRMGILPALKFGRQYRVERSEYERFKAEGGVERQSRKVSGLVLAH